jgi:hypothetical protein
MHLNYFHYQLTVSDNYQLTTTNQLLTTTDYYQLSDNYQLITSNQLLTTTNF